MPAHFAFFPAMYGRAARLQGGLAVLGSHAAMVAAAKAGSRGEQLAWSAAGAALGAVWPWTLLAMMPTNKTILKQVGWACAHGTGQTRSSVLFGDAPAARS